MRVSNARRGPPRCAAAHPSELLRYRYLLTYLQVTDSRPKDDLLPVYLGCTHADGPSYSRQPHGESTRVWPRPTHDRHSPSQSTRWRPPARSFCTCGVSRSWSRLRTKTPSALFSARHTRCPPAAGEPRGSRLCAHHMAHQGGLQSGPQQPRPAQLMRASAPSPQLPPLPEWYLVARTPRSFQPLVERALPYL